MQNNPENALRVGSAASYHGGDSRDGGKLVFAAMFYEFPVYALEFSVEVGSMIYGPEDLAFAAAARAGKFALRQAWNGSKWVWTLVTKEGKALSKAQVEAFEAEVKAYKAGAKSPGRVASNPKVGRFDFEHSSYDKALESARRNAGDLGNGTKKMYDPETGTLIGEMSADGKRGWRIDADHVNYWDWTGGKKGAGGKYGHDFFPPNQSGPHSKHIGHAPWED